MALYVGRGIMKALKATVFYDALESLFGKIRTTLPEEYLQHFGHIEKSLGVGAKSGKTYEWMNGIFEVISDAIVRRRFIDMTYFTMSRKQETHRKVAPYKIWFFDGSFYLIGNCGLREDIRIFALDRIRNVSLNPEAFEMPEDFDVEEFMKPSFGIFRGEPVEVRIRFAPDIAGYIGERQWHPSQKSVLERDGALILEMTVAGTEEIKFWALQWGSRAEVLKPASLRRQIREEGRKLSNMYSDPMEPGDPAD
jgi:predicted DNA-binding transcriptional regulator YafY